MRNVKTWANGMGIWHVAVPAHLDATERVEIASDALKVEIQSREPNADPTVWLFPTRVPDLDNVGRRVYRESLPREKDEQP